MSSYEGETRRLDMPHRPQWEYNVCACYVEYIKSAGREGVWGWVLEIDGTTQPMREGLAHLGRQGWELVTVQQAYEEGDTRGTLKYLHIYKRLAG